MKPTTKILLSLGFLLSLVTGTDMCDAATDKEKMKAVEEMFDSPFTEEMYYRTDRLLLTATKHLIGVREAPAIATVVTSEEIRNMGARNLLDVLERIPGFGVTRGFYSAYEVEVRGLKTVRTEKIKLMLDGHSLNYPLWGGAGWVYDSLSLENVERIEIIRGPGSALYGSNAFSAVINIVTKNSYEADGTKVYGGFGDNNTLRTGFVHGVLYNDTDVVGMFNYYDTNGDRLPVESDAIGNSGFTDDWAENWDAGLKINWKDITLNTKILSRKSGPYIGVTKALNDESLLNIDQYFIDVNYSKSINTYWQFHIKSYYDYLNINFDWELFPEGFTFPGGDTFPEGVLGSPSLKNKIYGFELGVDYDVTEYNTITFGSLYEKQKHFDIKHHANYNPLTFDKLGSFQDITSSANWSLPASREIWALYIQDELSITKNLRLTAGIRYDHYSDFGDTTNPRVGLVLNLSKKIDFKLLYGKSFRAPNFEELYSINNPVAIGNQSLNPEEIKTYEIAVGYRPTEAIEININGFYNEFKNRIELDQNLVIPQFHNAGDATIYGLETELHYHWKFYSFFANHTWQRPKDDATGLRLADVPSHRVNLGVDFEPTQYIHGNIHALYVSSRPRATNDNRSDLNAYTTINATIISKKFYKSTELRASCYNIFNESYSYPAPPNTIERDYPSPTRSYYFEIQHKF